MNFVVEMESWLQKQKALYETQAKEWFDLSVRGEVKEEEAIRNIHELIIKRRTLENVQMQVAYLETVAANESEEEVSSLFDEEEDGEEFDLFKDEEEIELPYPEED